MPPPDPADAFLKKWAGVSGSERANYQLFIGDLCRLLEVPEPEPAREDTRDNAYVFERRVTFAHGDGSTSAGYIAATAAAPSCWRSRRSRPPPPPRASTTR